MKSICFITTGDIKSIATSKRALGLAKPLSDLGWNVHILMEDCDGNRQRVSIECDNRINVWYFEKGAMMQERKAKNRLIKEIDPDYLYVCAFVTRNIVGIGHRSKKLVEHSELQTGITEIKGLRKFFCYLYEYYSILYGDVLLNASKYLMDIYSFRAKIICKGNMPMKYFPYAFNSDVINVVSTETLPGRFQLYVGKTVFVFLGTVTRNYGVFTILDAVICLKNKGINDFKVLILGKGRHFEEALKYVSDNGLQHIVEMPGFIDEEDIAYYFSVASAFISPMNDTVQDWARCPSKIYLYLPYKKPIITCKIGEPYEVLKDKGLYYSVGNSEDMALQMNNVINNNKAVDAHAELHSWRKRAEEFDKWVNNTFK